MAETDLPGLALRPGEDVGAAWARLPAGTRAAYVRFPRGGDLPLAALQRLARRGSILADAGPRDAADAVDLAVAGAAGVVAWLADGSDVADIAGALGDALLLGCTGADVGEAARSARSLGVPLLVADAEPPPGLHGYVLDAGASGILLRRFGAWPEEAPAPLAEAVDGAAVREGP